MGDEAEISAFLAKIDEEDGMTFAVRTRKPHPTREGELKWGTPQGEGWYSFDSIGTMLGSIQPSKEQRIDFRRDLREAILSPLRDRLRALEEEARLLRPFFPKKDDKKEGEAKSTHPNAVGLNGNSHAQEQSRVAL